MSRRCLYCGKDLSKESTSNFCSKDCWTEYKKVKSMNVDADKQATVLLKRNEIAGVTDQATPQANPYRISSEPVGDKQMESTPDIAQHDPASSQLEPGTLSGTLSNRIDQLEHTLSDHVEDFRELVERIQSRSGATTDSPTAQDDSKAANHKLVELEHELEKVNNYIRTLDKFNSRLISLEKRIKGLEIRQSGPVRKKGFFGRLFG